MHISFFGLTFKGKIPHSLLLEKNQSLEILFYLYKTNMLFVFQQVIMSRNTDLNWTC